MKTKILFFIGILFLQLLPGCVTRRATLQTFIDPSIQTTAVKTVAVFQMRNTAFSPGETMEMDRTITQAFVQKNGSVKIIGTTEAGTMINNANLASEFSGFLGDFENSGIANTVFLNKIKNLGIDAILQGRLFEVKQDDWARQRLAHTSLLIRYTILNTSNGKILWEGTSKADMEWYKRFAPSIYEVAQIAQQKIISVIPSLGK